MSLETPKESVPLIDIVQSNQGFVIAEAVNVEYMIGKTAMGVVALEPGDVIRVVHFDERHGLLFRCPKTKDMVVVPASFARSIQVEG